MPVAPSAGFKSPASKHPLPTSYNPTPFDLKPLVLDYLCHHGFKRTATAFVAESSPKSLNADGEDVPELPGSSRHTNALSPATLELVDRREEIRLAIQRGHIKDAEELLKRHFPSVLNMAPHPPTVRPGEPGSAMAYLPHTSVDPHDLNMNLKIQQFIEDCRTTPLSYPPESTPASFASSSTSTESSSPEQQTALLKSAQKLYAFATMIPDPEHKDEFIKQLTHVAGLLAYKVPETSTMKEYLSQSRRDAVAQQIMTAIIYKTGLPAISYAELRVRQASVIWSTLSRDGVIAPPGVPTPPTQDPSFEWAKMKQAIADKKSNDRRGGKDSRTPVPPFDFNHFLNIKP